MSELLKEMGQRILERRKQLNMTQETLANLTHLTSQTIIPNKFHQIFSRA